MDCRLEDWQGILDTFYFLFVRSFVPQNNNTQCSNITDRCYHFCAILNHTAQFIFLFFSFLERIERDLRVSIAGGILKSCNAKWQCMPFMWALCSPLLYLLSVCVHFCFVHAESKSTFWISHKADNNSFYYRTRVQPIRRFGHHWKESTFGRPKSICVNGEVCTGRIELVHWTLRAHSGASPCNTQLDL